MNTVEISMKTNRDEWYPNGEWLMIDDIVELYDHLDIVKDTTYKELVKLFKSQLPVDKWDHYTPPSDASAIVMAVGLSKIEGGNPIYTVDSCLEEISDNKVKSFLTYGNILLNEVGGYCNFDKDYMRIDNIKDYIPDNRLLKFHYIKEDTDYLNLENDPELEEYTKTQLEGTNFSYVTNLRDFNEGKLTSVIESFVTKGGHTLWQYTTGRDTDQMYTYTSIALDCGITRFYFVFNAGREENIETFLTWLRGNAEEVMYKFT